VRKVRLVTKHQQRDSFEFRLLQERVQFVPGDWECFVVGGVNNEPVARSEGSIATSALGHLHDGVHAPTIPFPHRSKPGLAAEVPATVKLAISRRLFASSSSVRSLGACSPLQSDVTLLNTLHIEPDGGN
jgi:hypothetical protein